jgi:hypothetical protein
MTKKADKPTKWLLVGRYFGGELDDRPYTTAEIMDYARRYNEAHSGEAGHVPYALRVAGDSIVDANQHPQDTDNYEVAIRQRGHNALSWLAMIYESRAQSSVLYHAKGAIKARGRVRGLTRREKHLVRCGELVYFVAPYRGRRRLYLIDCRGTWRAKRYFARRPLAVEVRRMWMLGATIDPALRPAGWALPGEGAEL